MKNLGKKQHPILGEIDNIEMEEFDFDYSKEFEDLTLEEKANFLSFIKVGMLPRDKNHPVYKMIVDRWYCLQQKNN